MQKVYLLRNDRKTGPFTLPELMQQSLQPTDLLWIEGESTGWTALSDLEFHPSHLHHTVPTPETATSLEDKAEALRRRALEVPPRVFTRTPDTLYNYHEEEPGDDTILLIDHRKQKNNMVSEVLMTLFIVALLGGGLLGGRKLFRTQASGESPVVTRMSTSDQHTAVSAQPVITPSAAPSSDTAAASAPAPSALTAIPVHRAAVANPLAHIASAKPKAVEDTQKLVVKTVKETIDGSSSVPPDQKNEAKEENKTAASPLVEEKAEPQKHKGLGQAIKNLFRKKKKDTAEDKEEN